MAQTKERPAMGSIIAETQAKYQSEAAAVELGTTSLPQGSPAVESALNAAPESPFKAGSSGADILDLFGDESEEDEGVYQPFDVYDGTHFHHYFVKTLTPHEEDEFHADVARKRGGPLQLQSRQSEAETAKCLAVAKTVYRNVADEGEKPFYQLAFTLGQIIGIPEQRDNSGNVTQKRVLGLVERRKAEAKYFWQELAKNAGAANPATNYELRDFLLRKTVYDLGLLSDVGGV